MTSIFQKDKLRRGPAVSFLLLEVLHDITTASAPAANAAEQLDLLMAAAARCGLSWEPKDALAAMQRLQVHAEKPRPAAGDVKITTGVTMSTYLQELDPAQLCLLTADFNLEAARRLYCDEDFEIVQSAAGEKTRYEMIRYYSMQEATAIGFGGTPDDTGKPAKAKGQSSKVADVSVESLNDRLGILRGRKRH